MGARILNGVEATGAGPAIKSGAAQHGVMVWFTNSGGSVTALKFKLQGRIRGPDAPATWVDLTTSSPPEAGPVQEATFSGGELTAKAAVRFFLNQPVDDIRINITTLTETGTTAVYAEYKSELN